MPTLVIMAAGLGSRYGGTKQLDYITDEDETIIDFSIYDAIEAGFKTIVFVVRDSILSLVKSQFKDKFDITITVKFVCQDVKAIPDKFKPNNRTKPWGTAHALLTAKPVVSSSFCVINADDFYGKDAFKAAAKFLSTNTNELALIGFPLKNTLSENGTVSRGICKINNGYLDEINEKTKIKLIDNKIINAEAQKKEALAENALVSMNMWVFTTQIFEVIENRFEYFLKQNSSSTTAEFYIPTVVQYIISNKVNRVKVIKTNSEWFGVTYKADKANVVSKISDLKSKGIYPKHLWKN